MDADASEQLAKERTRNRENLRKLVAVNKEKEALTRHAASLQAERDDLAAEMRSIAEAHELAQAQVDALAEELAAQRCDAGSERALYSVLRGCKQHVGRSCLRRAGCAELAAHRAGCAQSRLRTELAAHRAGCA